LEASLAALTEATDGALVVRSGEPAEVVAEMAESIGARSVHITGEVTPYGRRRDEATAAMLSAAGLPLVATGSPYAVRLGTVLTAARTPFQVFTPFSRAWRELAQEPPHPVPPGLRWRGMVEGEPLDDALVELG